MGRRTRKAAASARRARFLLSGVLALAVLTGGGLYLARGESSPGPAPRRPAMSPRTAAAGCGAADTGLCAANPAGIAVAAPPAVVTMPSASARPPSRRPVPPPASATQGGVAAAFDSMGAAQVLALINQARSAAGLPALTVTSGLLASSSAHNLRMASGCGLTHQCPGEPPIGDREIAAGVDWTFAGENIGEGGPVADSAAAIAQMAVGLTQSMLNERPPDDDHRLNILSSRYTHIGVAVYRDSSGIVWLTQDFSN